jgi:hypothetical protein
MRNRIGTMSYQNGKIYEIVGGGKRYIGSTTETLPRRLSKHKANKKAHEAGKREWTSCYELLDYSDCVISLLENYPCHSKEELRRREGDFIKELPCINKIIAGRTDKEWRNANKELIQKSYVKRKEKIECECGASITKWNISRHKKQNCPTQKDRVL